MHEPFQDLSAFSSEDVEAAICRNDPRELPLVPVTIALLADGPSPAQDLCIRLAHHAAPLVRGNAVIALGHLARRFRVLDEIRVRPLIEAALADPEPRVRVLAKSAADEIHQFLHWTIAGHSFG